MITIKGLNKFFNKGRSNEIHVLNDMELQLPEKGMVALFGQSGCGKTTLLNIIGGLDTFESGSVTVHGENIKSATDTLRNRDIGYVFQNYNLNNGVSCYDNVADALRLCGIRDENEIERRVTAALSNVGMINYKNRTPDTLSGGQQQRVAIARAIVKSPRIILADEPTGNLDEANTVMIMDMLKKISREHLVVLVTHEADLVDYYSDSVIELKDGRVVGVRNNESANGYVARDKNHVYLGELEKCDLADVNAEIEYFGDRPASPVKLKIVNHNGKLYIRIDSPGVQILDDYSEVKLKEGVYSHKEPEKVQSDTTADMTELPPIEGNKFGKLFTFKSSVKSGYLSNFGKKKRGQKLLKRCMCLFASVLVIMSAMFGTSISSLLDASGSYNHNVFYVHTPDGEASKMLNDAVGNKTSGIDYVIIHSAGRQLQDHDLYFRTGYFETFEPYFGSDGFSANAVYLSVSLITGKPVLAGKTEGLAENDIVISSAVADKLLERSTLGYITEYNDLIGLVSSSNSINRKSLRIAGVVESNETAVYVDDIALARQVLSRSNLKIALDTDFSYTAEPGKVIYYQSPHEVLNEDIAPEIGDKIKIHGKELEIAQILKLYASYDEWLNVHGFEKSDMYAYLGNDKTDPYESDRLLEWYTYYYSELDSFLIDYYRMMPGDFQLWMAVEKNIEVFKYIYVDHGYWKAIQYKEKFGKNPTMNEINNMWDKLPEVYTEADKYYKGYQDEFYQNPHQNTLYESTYIVDEQDYIAFSKQKGETDPLVSREQFKDGIIYKSVDVYVDYDYGYGYYGDSNEYTVVHSADPEATKQWLDKNAKYFPDIDEDWAGVVSPSDIFNELTEFMMGMIAAELITLFVVLILLSVCMYFIMRSSLMGRVKEIGIYRAIGVSRKNLIFKFLVETSVLSFLTVFVGYLLSSAFVMCCLNLSPLMSQVMFYPIWYAGLNLVILMGVCLLCGVLPIISLLIKTPSQILAKYDI